MSSEDSPEMQITIKELEHEAEAQACAQLMAGSEPWLTLGRDYEASLAILSDPGREIYLALNEGEIVGFVVLVLQGAFVGYMQSVAVAAPWRGRGIGRRLMTFAEERIFTEFPNVFICVSSFNERAMRLYQRLGYEVVGELKAYIVPEHSEILLRKSIAPLAEFKRPG